MDYVALSSTDSAHTGFWTIVFIASVILAVACGVALMFDDGVKRLPFRRTLVAFLVVGLSGAIVSVGGVTFANVVMRVEARDAWEQAIKEETSTVYDLKLTDKELASLEYPREKPSEDFAVYGSFDTFVEEGDAAFEKRELYLIWQDDMLKLAQSSDGVAFEPLSASKE